MLVVILDWKMESTRGALVSMGLLTQEIRPRHRSAGFKGE